VFVGPVTPEGTPGRGFGAPDMFGGGGFGFGGPEVGGPGGLGRHGDFGRRGSFPEPDGLNGSAPSLGGQPSGGSTTA